MSERLTLISYEAPLPTPHGVEWTGSIDAADGRHADVHFSFTHPDVGAVDPSPRPWLLTFLLPAMAVGAPVEVRGPVDDDVVQGLMEWQEAMVCWRPHLRVVPIRGEEEGPETSRRGPNGWRRARRRDLHGAVTAFSGGVDSCFTAVRHTTAGADALHRVVPLRAGVMVHGLDIALEDTAVFASAYARSERMLTSLGLEAHRLHTDVRQLETSFGCDWETEAHGIWLAACLACFDGRYGANVIPSTYPYDQQRLPWASNPLTDPLLGSTRHPVIHDGAAHDKLDKVATIAQQAAVEADVRVCWQGDRLDRNCGQCFKCLVTQVCFWLSGVERPSAFDRPGTLEEVGTLELTDPYKVHLGRRMLAAAEARGDRTLVAALARALEGAS